MWQFGSRESPSPGSTRRLALGTTVGALLTLAAVVPPGVHAQPECEDVSGVWTVDVAFAQAPQQVTVTLEQTECEITGLVKGNNETPIGNGLVDGATFTFDTSLTNEETGESLVIHWQGTVEGDDVAGSLTTQMMPVADFTGTRGEPGPTSSG